MQPTPVLTDYRLERRQRADGIIKKLTVGLSPVLAGFPVELAYGGVRP